MPPDAPVISTVSPGRTRSRSWTTRCDDENGQKRDAGLLVVDARRQRQPHPLVANEILRVRAERLMAGNGEIARQVAEAARGLGRIRVFGMGDADDAVAGLEARHRAPGRDHLARRLAAELLRQREGRPSGDLITRQIAGPVLHVPARDRARVFLHQHVAVAERRQIVFAEDELLRPAVFEQPDRRASWSGFSFEGMSSAADKDRSFHRSRQATSDLDSR